MEIRNRIDAMKLNKKIISAYAELSKPSILTLVLVTTSLGFYLGGKGIHDWGLFAWMMSGAACVCAGASALNHYMERDIDCKMLRTRNRPIPRRVISPASALNYGIIMVALGVIVLDWKVNLLTAFLSLLTAFLYVLVYTPMKRISWLNTTIGAIPGAIPPMGGWVAATNHLDAGAWILFGILFLWQHPHFYAIAWMFKEDYERGGFKMLPVVEPDGNSTFAQIQWSSLLLIPFSLLPTLTGLSGKLYFAGALLAGILFWKIGRALAHSKSIHDARKLLKASVLYLPVLLFLIVIDVSF